ncbi:MAG: hypothetical protein GPJ54_18960 [Candidatus Heimdallarchaeota archaeon]|nr:hypothetical protein [Candidatus Heimdallarchaeota archaeon]
METSEAKKTLLAIFAHSDDELGCVGTMANYAEAGHNVVLAFLTKGENASTLTGDAKEIMEKRKRHTESIEALLGVTVRYLDFIDSNIENTVENGYKVAEFLKEIKPDIIITWSKYDSVGGGHPDHRNCADLVRDSISYARYKRNGSSLDPFREKVDFYTYFNPMQGTNNRLTYVDVTHQTDKIRDFIQIYKEAYGDWPVDDFKQSTMVSNGMQSGVKYAEVFEVVNQASPVSKFLT